MKSGFSLVAHLVASAALALAIAADMPATAAAQSAVPFELPAAPGKELVEAVCATCHAADYLEKPRTPAEWSDVISKMEGYGAQADGDEWGQVRKYIMGQLAVIEVNKASAFDLSAALDIDEKLAATIVDYRMGHGDFKTIEDVKKVPNLDARKVDARKSRFRF